MVKNKDMQFLGRIWKCPEQVQTVFRPSGVVIQTPGFNNFPAHVFWSFRMTYKQCGTLMYLTKENDVGRHTTTKT